MKISTIMPSFLGDYPNAAKNREKKFIRAVNSFINQTYKDEKELIIVGDGCQKTKEIYEANWKNNKEIIYFGSVKMPTFSGGVRDIGLKIATGDIVCYLDSDDVFGKEHLQTIADQFTDDIEWAFYNDFVVLDQKFSKFQLRWVDQRYGSIGTSSMCHRNPKKCEKLKDIKWFSGYGHDWLFILSIISKNTKSTKFKKNPQYIVCHTNSTDW